MPRPQVALNRPNIVGSFGQSESIGTTAAAVAAHASDLVEIRLDLVVAAGTRDVVAFTGSAASFHREAA